MHHSLSPPKPDLTVVIPCLNEEDTLGICLTKLQDVSKHEDISIEVIVADNGSVDKSCEIASKYSAKLVHVSEKGYGAAIMGGIKNATSQYILMADADDSYDFLEVPKFFRRLEEGFDLVQGCRLPKGGGTISKGAMPWSHRYIGNPLFTLLAQNWFGSPINDIYCGMRAFKKCFYESLKMKCKGMEFATEMIIKAANTQAKMTEVAITLHQDGRIQHPPHLRTIRDGWRTLQFFLLCAPSKLFLLPGVIMLLAGLLGSCLGYFGATLGSVQLGAHTMLGSALIMVSGYQAILMHNLSLSVSEKLGIVVKRRKKYFKNFILSKGMTCAGFFMLSGILLWANVFSTWQTSGFSSLDYSSTLKIVIPGATLISISLETIIFILFQSWIRVETNS